MYRKQYNEGLTFCHNSFRSYFLLRKNLCICWKPLVYPSLVLFLDLSSQIGFYSEVNLYLFCPYFYTFTIGM